MSNKEFSVLKLGKKHKELSDDFKRDEMENVKEKMLKANKKEILCYRKDARVNLRVSSKDLAHLKQIAAYEGIPYQTLIASILHKFSRGYLNREEEVSFTKETDLSKV